MSEQRHVRVIIRKTIFDFVPIPQLAFSVKLSAGAEKQAREMMEKRILTVFAHEPAEAGRIFCASLIDKIDAEGVHYFGQHRVEIKEILVNNQKTLKAIAEIKDYLPEKQTETGAEIKNAFMTPIGEFCGMLNGFFGYVVFEDKIIKGDYLYFDYFLDGVMAALIKCVRDQRWVHLRGMFLSHSRQKTYLSLCNTKERAELLCRLLSEMVEFLLQADEFDFYPPKHDPVCLAIVQRKKEEKPPDSDGGTPIPVKTEETPYQKWAKRVDQSGVPPEALKEVKTELLKIGRDKPGTSEYANAENYLELVCSLPWNKSTKDNIDIGHARKILDSGHSGLEAAKERIVEYLAVKKLKPSFRGSILCFIGPPGTGKTSLGSSIARAMNRRFVRLPLGGLREEAELKGHRRTFIGALPGQIINSIKKAGVNNPVFVLDEIDKVGKGGVRGDPESILLEVLDPEHNHAFLDHYLSAPFDLSNVFFIATGNAAGLISPTLRDRMEIVEFDSYTPDEKITIAQRHLAPKSIERHGLTPQNLSVSDEAIERIIRLHTREAGVRQLERAIAVICRKVAVRTTQGKTSPTAVTERNIHDFLGSPKFGRKKLDDDFGPGVAVGLAWTPSGGDVLLVETCKLPREASGSNLIITGNLKNVIRESIQVAMTLVKKHAAECGIEAGAFDQHKLHIHLPEGAVPKDGPSAGVTMAAALASLFANKPVRTNLAMTGEITLRGSVSPVGGLKEKIAAGKQEGITEFIVPEDNKSQIEEIPARIRQGLIFHYVSSIKDVFKIIFA